MKNKLHILPIAVGLLTLVACASISHPDGGPRDVEPPRFVSANPAPGSVNVSPKRINIYFDENIQLDDPSLKVVVSPSQTQQPRVTALGKHVSIEFNDTLLPNTTYTIDLGDAVKDLNEGNVLDGFATDFSTGPVIDSLRISGMVLQARNLEPAQGMLVGVYANNESDTAISTLRFDRITRTNQLGQFTLRNLPAGSYQLFAINDVNRDLHWDRSEDIAFFGEMITPGWVPSTRNDTLKDSNGLDSVVIAPATRFLPDDLLLTWFNEDYKSQYLKDYARPERHIIYFKQNAPVDTLPQLRIIALGSREVDMNLRDISVLSRNVGGDSLNFWLVDSAVRASDSLLVQARYRRVDSLDQLVWVTDTLKFNYRERAGKGKKATKAHIPTLQEKIDSVLAKNDTIPIDTFQLMQPSMMLNICLGGNTQELNKPLTLVSQRPMRIANPDGIRLEMMPDTLWEPFPAIVRPIPDTLSQMQFTFDVNWTPGMKYRLVVDSMAITDPYGIYNRGDKLEFKARETEDYSTLTFNISGIPDGLPAIIEIMKASEEIITTASVNGSQARIEYLLPDTYFARLFIDADNNGEYTSGMWSGTEHRQPEDVYYFPKRLQLKKNWDRTEIWDLQALSPELQKIDEIKKNKPRENPGEKNRKKDLEGTDDDEDEGDYYDDYGDSDGFGNNPYRTQ